MTQLNLAELFMEKAAAAAAQAERVAGVPQALARAVEIAQAQDGGTLAVVGWDDAALAEIDGLCQKAGLTLITGGLRGHGQGFAVGLTPAHFGLANTGTLVLDCADEDLRLCTMLAETHVAVLPVSRLRADLAVLGPELDAIFKRGPAYAAFITGPSRTADIELKLTVGAHGPAKVHILLWEDEV